MTVELLTLEEPVVQEEAVAMAPVAPFGPAEPLDPAFRFVIALGRALHGAGAPSDRLEDTLTMVAEQLGVEAQFFSTPTSLLASMAWPGQEPRTVMIRVQPGVFDLGRLEAVDRLAGRVSRGELSTTEGMAELHVAVRASFRRPAWLEPAAFGAASWTAGVFLGGSWIDTLACTVAGVCVGLLLVLTAPRPRWARLIDFACGAIASIVAVGFLAAGVPVTQSTVTIGGLIVLVPGLTLTLAMSELVARHLVGGTARLMYAIVIFLSIGFGVTLGAQAEGWFDTVEPTTAPVPTPGWAMVVALLVAPLAFCVVFRASFARYWIMLACAVAAVGGSRLGAATIGPELGSSVGAFLTGITANLYARFRRRPASIGLVPGVLLLVPGSIGLRSFSSLAADNVVGGVEAAFSAFLIAASIAAGLVLANATVRARQPL